MDSIFDLNILERYVSEGLLRKAEKRLKQYFSNLPDEIVIEAEQYKKELQEEYNKIQELINQEFEKTKDIPIKKLYKYFEENPCEYKGCIYNLRNGKDISKIIIKFIEPKNVEGE